MILFVAFLCAGAGFAALALAMDRHHRQVRRRTPSWRQRQWLRASGCVGLMASWFLCNVDSGWGTGTVLWLGLLSLTGLISVLSFAAIEFRSTKPRMSKSKSMMRH